ncbi:MAG TPA: hypothetical protein VMD77_01510 [Candidatus Baltobacteraceae bacterium]|jgi:hypothetical protein|nr:hypothetical protein [Candidatus Baltobacteraceae bacterium]
MANWGLTCKGCGATFRYSEITEATLEDYLMPAKPDIPLEGMERECPRCKAKFTYQKSELIYQTRREP